MTEHQFLDGRSKQLLIGGRWIDAKTGETFESRNPANGALLATVAKAREADVDLAVEAARAAFEAGPWPRFSSAERQQLLLRLAELLERDAEAFARLDTLDMGMPLWRTRGAVRMLIDLLRFFAGRTRSINGETLNPSNSQLFACTLREPVGVCGAIIPWNSPAWSAVLKLAPVLATGCTLVLKPAEDASLAPLMLGALAQEAGVPPGVFNVITGFGCDAGAALASHLGVDKLSFTGSTETGRAIVAASAGNLKRLSLELGGKSPNIIFADADLELAARTAAVGAFGNSGQMCSAGTRLFVERPVHDAFVTEFARQSKDLRVGDGLDANTILGPLVSSRQLERVSAHMADAVAAGATPVCGGSRLTGPSYDQGFFFPPTIVGGATDEMRVVREEIFGPVVAVLPFDDEAEAVARANRTPYGLGAGVWSKDIGRAMRLSRSLKAGSVWVNCYNEIDPAVPAGGVKGSGYGREYGAEHLDEHLQTKSLWIASGGA